MFKPSFLDPQMKPRVYIVSVKLEISSMQVSTAHGYINNFTEILSSETEFSAQSYIVNLFWFRPLLNSPWILQLVVVIN